MQSSDLGVQIKDSCLTLDVDDETSLFSAVKKVKVTSAYMKSGPLGQCLSLVSKYEK